MSTKKGPDHVVVDGSNIATEGRSLPSLAQLQEAVMSFMEEHPNTAITVVVDATFGHRIEKREVAEYEEGIANNELVAPPAGAVGRGDAFVLGIADKANASVLSNDSFQEFHGDYEWLFDEGRLIGGKPVPHVGWVFVERVPVRGPVSRKATAKSKSSKRSSSSGRRASKKTAGKASKAASEPMPTPKSPPPSSKSGSKSGSKDAASERKSPAKVSAADADSARKPAPKGTEAVNDLLPFIEFVEHHPVGTEVVGVVDAYSSHGAYVTVAGTEGDHDVRAYIPLRLMADPAPRSARKLLAIGEQVDLVVVSFSPDRRSIDCAMPALAPSILAEEPAAPAEEAPAAEEPEPEATPRAKKAATRKRTARKKTAAKKTAAKKSTAKKTAAKKSTAKKTTAKKTAAKKSAAKKTAAKKTAAKKSAAKKTAAKKTAARKTAAKKSTAKKTATRKRTAAKKTAASSGSD